MRKHAILSASSAHRWMRCPPSARLCEKYEDKDSDYARQGTCAHEVCQYKLEELLGRSPYDPREHLDFYDEEMESCADGYAAFVMEKVEEAKKTCADPLVLIEQRLDFSAYVPEGFGTGDCVIVSDGTLHVIDYKDCWTDEYKARASEYRRSHAAMGKKGASCFTSKIKCAKCGSNYRRQSTKVKYTEDGRVSHWRCNSQKGCGSVGLKDHILREMAAEVLGLETFDEETFLAKVDKIVADGAHLTFYLKDGTIAGREYDPPASPRPKWTEEQRAKFRESVKDSYTPERRKQMSEHMKKLRREKPERWRRK